MDSGFKVLVSSICQWNLDSGFHTVDSGFQVLDSSICQWNLDSGFQSLLVFQIP